MIGYYGPIVIIGFGVSVCVSLGITVIAGEIVSIASSHWQSGLKGSILVVVPPPVTTELSQQEVEEALRKALDETKQKNIHGSNTTPFLLQRMAELTGGKSVKSNLDLLKNNAKIAAQISRSYTNLHGKSLSDSVY